MHNTDCKRSSCRLAGMVGGAFLVSMATADASFLYLRAFAQCWKVEFITTVGFLRGLSPNRVSWVGPRSGQAALDQNLQLQKWELGDLGRQATQSGSTKEKTNPF